MLNAQPLGGCAGAKSCGNAAARADPRMERFGPPSLSSEESPSFSPCRTIITWLGPLVELFELMAMFIKGPCSTQVRREFRPILLDQRRQWIARNTNGARRSPQHYIAVPRKDSPRVPEQSFQPRLCTQLALRRP